MSKSKDLSYQDFSNYLNESSSIKNINEIYENSDEGYIEKLYQINNSFADNIGKIYINDSTNFSIIPTNIDSMVTYNFKKEQNCINHYDEEEFIKSNKYCLNCNQNYCDNCIIKCIKFNHIVFDIDFLNQYNLNESINLLITLKNFNKILSGFLDICDYKINKIKKIKLIKLEELKEYQNFILDVTNREIENKYLIKKELISYKNYFENKENKLTELLETMKNNKNKTKEYSLKVNSKIEKYEKKFNSDNDQLKKKIVSFNQDLFNFNIKENHIKKENQQLNINIGVEFDTSYFNYFKEKGNIQILFDENNFVSFKLELYNSEINEDNNFHTYYINVLLENKKKNKCLVQPLFKEKNNNNDNKIIFSYSFKKKDFFLFLGNDNELNFEIFLCKYIFLSKPLIFNHVF